MTDKQGLGAQGDDFYELLMQAHENLSVEESQALNARLILLLADHVGDLDTLQNLLEEAGRFDKA